MMKRSKESVAFQGPTLVCGITSVSEAVEAVAFVPPEALGEGAAARAASIRHVRGCCVVGSLPKTVNSTAGTGSNGC
jgi:hypothetical protein